LILEEAALGEDVELLDSLDVLLLEAELADLELDTEDSSELPVAEASTNELVAFPTPLETPLLSEVVVTKPEEVVVVLRSTLVILVLAAPVTLFDALARPVLGAFITVTVPEEPVALPNAVEKPVLAAAAVVERNPEEVVASPLSDGLPVVEASTNELVIFPTPLGTPLLSEVVVTKPEEVVVLRSTLVTLVLAAPVADPPLESPVVLPDALVRPVLGAFVPVTVFEELVVFANALEKPVLGARCGRGKDSRRSRRITAQRLTPRRRTLYRRGRRTHRPTLKRTTRTRTPPP